VSSGGSRGGWSQPDHDEDAAPLEILADRYERVDLIGAGGMGRVYEAFDRRLQRTVALKEVAPHLAGTPAARRLATEALLTADLEHPGIVSVHDAGRTDDGRLFYTMRLVRGRSLAERLAEAQTLPERLALLRHLHDACHAVGYAHARSIIHRDLKPANIMVGEFGETQVVDWGLARRLDEEGIASGSVGTEGYMSPEAHQGGLISTRSDVFSLGATLREVAGPEAPPDLAAIAARALTDDPDERYPDAHELAQDLGRFLDGRQVAAYDYSTAELLRRLVAAWRAPIAVGVIAALLLGATAAGAYLRTSRARDRALWAEADTREALEAADAHLASSLEAQAAAAVREGRLPAAQVLAANALRHGESPLARGVLLADLSRSRPLAVDVAAVPECTGITLGDEELICRTATGLRLVPDDGGEGWTLEGSYGDTEVAGDIVAVTRPDRKLEIRERATGEVRHTYDEMPGEHRLAAAPDGLRVGMANGFLMTVIDTVSGDRWDAVPCGEGVPALGTAFGPDEVFVICLSGEVAAYRGPDERRTVERFPIDAPGATIVAYTEGRLLCGMGKGMVEVLDAATGERLSSVQAVDGSIDHLAPLRGTRLVAISGDRAGVRLWNLDAGVEVVRLPAPTRTVRPRGPDSLAVVGDDLRVWTLPAIPRPRRFQALSGLTSLAISPDGALIAASQGVGSATIWSTEDGAVVVNDRWQDRVAKWVAFRPDGSELVATGLGSQDVRTISTTDYSMGFLPRAGLLRRITALKDGRLVAANYGKGVMIHDGEGWTGHPVGWTTFDLATTPDAGAVWVLGDEGNVGRLRANEPEVEPRFRRASARAIAASADRLAFAHNDHVVVTDDAGTELQRLDAGDGGVIDVALSPDGVYAAAGMLDGTARLWSIADERLVGVLVGHSERVAAVVFSADSRSLFTGDWAGTLLRWSLTEAERPADELADDAARTWQLKLDDALAAGR
jgi:eukaryotic-like serine/threonine-protein kinase